jgi:hypothetical protein
MAPTAELERPTTKVHHHEIKIVLKGEDDAPKGKSASLKGEYPASENQYAAPAHKIPVMHVGQTVSHSCDSDEVAEVRIVFPDCSPFRDDHVKGTEVSGNETLTLLTPGDLPSRCYLKLKDGRVLGWSAAYPDAGGDYHVRKP